MIYKSVMFWSAYGGLDRELIYCDWLHYTCLMHLLRRILKGHLGPTIKYITYFLSIISGFTPISLLALANYAFNA